IDAEQLSDADLDAGLLEGLPRAAGLRRLAVLAESAGERPASLEGRLPSADEQEPSAPVLDERVHRKAGQLLVLEEIRHSVAVLREKLADLVGRPVGDELPRRLSVPVAGEIPRVRLLEEPAADERDDAAVGFAADQPPRGLHDPRHARLEVRVFESRLLLLLEV